MPPFFCPLVASHLRAARPACHHSGRAPRVDRRDPGVAKAPAGEETPLGAVGGVPAGAQAESPAEHLARDRPR